MIERNRALLLQALLKLFVLAGLTPDGPPVASLRHGLRLTLLRLIRPAEAAARRLIFVQAQAMAHPQQTSSERRRGTRSAPPSGSRAGGRSAGFMFSDPRLRCAPSRRSAPSPGPRIGVIGVDDHLYVSPAQPKPVDSTRLCQRMQALYRVLQDIPGYAEKLLRRASRAQARPGASAIAIARAQMPMRPGRPPGHRRIPQHQIDELLQECHTLALHVRWRGGTPKSSV